MNFEQNGSCDQKMLLLKYTKLIKFYFYSSLIPNYSKDYQSLPHISDEAASYMDFNSDMKYLTADRPNYVIADRPNGASNKMVRELKDSRL